jgi:hypothetical protein
MVVVRRSLIGCALAGVSAAQAQIPQVRIPAEVFQKLGAESKVAPVRLKVAPGRTKAATPKSAIGWLDSNVLKRIDVTGQRSLGYHSHSVTGDREAFNSLTYYGNGGKQFTDVGNMSVSGRKVLGVLDFQMQFTDTRLQDPDAQKVTLNYDRGPIKVSMGDIRGSLVNTNRFAGFTKQLNGVMAGFDDGRLQFRAVRSQSRGSARTVNLEGNNSTGPYYLQSGRILSDTIEVRVDGQPMKLMEDYVVDSDLGAITFVNRIIPPTSTIVASYEATSFNESRGTVQGAGLAYNFGPFGKVGFTAMEQRAGNTGRGSSLKEEFQGFGIPSEGYPLDYEPLAGSVIVRVNGVIQVPGTAEPLTGDYHFDPLLPNKFYIHRYVDNSQTVTVTYRPKTVQTLNGDRRVWGLDYRLPIGNKGANGYLQYNMARGDLIGTDNPLGGMARGLDGEYRLGNLRLRGSWRDIPNTFVSVETRGFNRNEVASDLGLEYDSGRFQYGLSSSNSAVSSRRTANDGSLSFDYSRITSTRGFAKYNDPGGTRWSLEHSRAANRLRSDSRLDTTSFTGSRNFGKIDANWGFDLQNGRGPISNGTANPVVGDVKLQTFRTGLNFNLGGGLSLGSRLGFSTIDALGKRGNGSDISVNASYRPSDAWSVTTGFTQSDSGQVASLGGFSSGAGYGYGGNGFSGGSVGNSFTGASTSNLRLFQINTAYRASDRVSLNARYYDSHSEGDLVSNTKTQAYGLGMEWDLGNFNLFSASLDRSATTFLGTVATPSNATSFHAALSGSPRGRWAYNLGVTGLVSGGTSQYRQNSLLFDGSLGYRISPRQRASFSFTQGRTAGYYGQAESYLAASYQYQIFRNLALVGNYKVRRLNNLDASLTSGAYRSSGFDLELSFDFAP